jgi:NADPH2:quinone reductase
VTVSARAARLVEHGQPLQVQDVVLPAPGADEAVVHLEYAGVNPVDRYAALGRVAPDCAVPRTLGGEGAGHLDDGTRVLAYGGGLGSTRDGVFATAAIVPRDAVFEVPDGVALPEAASMGVAGLTAYRAVERSGIGPDDRVLVLAASGGVGLAVVSYAASKGAQVWGQTTSAAKADAIRQVGAKDVVVTDAAGLINSVHSFAPTVVIDSLGGEFTASALRALEPRGRLLLFGTSAEPQATIALQDLYRRQLTVLSFAGLIATSAERREGLAEAFPALADGRLKIRIDREVMLEDVNQAFDALGDRSLTGKVVLRLAL